MNWMEDYYQILRVAPNASDGAIRKAYRKLAMQYHPDKTGNSEMLDDYFKKINEAYTVLSNPEQRRAFHLKYYAAHLPAYTITNGASILAECIQLQKKVLQQADNVNEDAVLLMVTEIILSANNLLILKEESNTILIEKIRSQLIALLHALNYKNSLQLYETIEIRLSFDGTTQKTAIEKLLQEKKQRYYWDKYKFFVALLAAILICIGIYKIA
ncbi:MAG: J domain-containing protein [Hydrotalea flava]|uniref:J domain-containing protein n=1 Tax=Hydrotalea TaxID=1004300 RepID=UPI000942969D|nr:MULTISPECIES: J domain-containing protein [Hydrotalea]MBY0346759.1 J domain-containing protein [Hydrotalea flava]